MEKINIAELLKDCPEGTELDCTMFENVTFKEVVHETDCDGNEKISIILLTHYSDGMVDEIILTKYGTYTYDETAKCVIFPKGKTTWEGFHRPFKDGDIVFYDNCVSIFKEWGDETLFRNYVKVDIDGRHSTLCDRTHSNGKGIKREARFATKEEKAKLFQAIKDNGYKWNAETKILEKLIKPIFRVGDTIQNKVDKYLAKRTIKSFTEGIGYFTTINDWVRIDDQDNWELVKDPIFKIGDEIRKKDGSDYRLRTIESINNNYYIIKTPDWFDNCYITDKLPFNYQDEYELVHSNKFDINTLKPFESRVLVRDTDHYEWEGAIFGRYDGNTFFTIGGIDWRCCIPYENNEHLLGTTNDCDDFYKTWEK